MKVWLGLVLILGCAAVVAACAGHDWASPFDLARALAGDDSLRSRLLVEWRIPRVFAAAICRCIARTRRRRFPGCVSQSPGRTLSARVGRWSRARRHRRAARSARTAAIVAPSRAGVCRRVGRDRPGHRRLSGCRRRRRRRHAARRRCRRGGAGGAAFIHDARIVGRDREPAGRAELGARRGADAEHGPCLDSSARCRPRAWG